MAAETPEEREMRLQQMRDRLAATLSLVGGHGILLGMADEISAHFMDCGMVSCSVSLWAVLGTKVLARWASIGSTSYGDGNSWPTHQ